MGRVARRIFWIVLTAAVYGAVFHHGDLLEHAWSATSRGMASLTASAHAAGSGDEPALLTSSRSVRVGFSPGNAEALVINTISSARTSIELAAYSFTSKPVAQALVQARRRGVAVRVVMDKKQRTARYSSATFLANAGVPVRIDAKYAIMHNKFMVVDGKTVQTGSFNYTRSAHVRNAENVVVIAGVPAIARTYSNEWTRLWAESSPYQARL